jgi:2-aminomuconate deaminase
MCFTVVSQACVLQPPRTVSQHVHQTSAKIATMYPNGEAFLLNADGPEGPTRFPQARSVSTNSSTIYVSGIASILPDGTVAGAEDGEVPDARKQTSTILRIIDTIIKGASDGKGGIANLIDAVVYLTDMERDYAGMNEEWNKVFASRNAAPARATIGVKDLPDTRFVVEVKGVAIVEE